MKCMIDYNQFKWFYKSENIQFFFRFIQFFFTD